MSKWGISNIFQITPSLLALRMTTERMTNHNSQWVPPSLRKEWQIHVLMRFQRNPYLGESLLSYYVSEYFPTTPDYITAHAEVLGGPVLCPALLRLTMSHPGGVLMLHQDVGVTDIECWVIVKTPTSTQHNPKTTSTNLGFDMNMTVQTTHHTHPTHPTGTLLWL